jgi:ABC-type sugar transport system substrate-binding protein
MSTFQWRPHRAALAPVIAAVLLLVAACGVFSGSSSFGGESTTPLPKTLVFSPLSLDPPVLKTFAEQLKRQAEAQGWEVIVQDPDFNATKQVQQLTEVIDSGRAGAAWVLAVAPDSMGPVLEAAQSKGIPVVTNGKPADYGFSGPQPGVTFSYIDYAAGGKMVGEQLGTCVNEKLDGKATVLHAADAEDTAGKEEFNAAVTKSLAATAPGAKISLLVVTLDQAQAQTDIGSVLEATPDITAVVSAKDEGALGALGAFAAAGKSLPCMVGFIGNDKVLKKVAENEMYAAVALNFKADVKRSLGALAEMRADSKMIGDVYAVPLKLTTAKG